MQPARSHLATAGVIAAVLGLAVDMDDRLAELSLGGWEGLTRDEICARDPAALAGTSRWDWYFRAPDGESFESASARLATWLAAVQRPTIAVGHGVAGRVLRGLYLRLDRAEMLQLPVRRDGVFKLAAGRITFIEAQGAENG